MEAVSRKKLPKSLIVREQSADGFNMLTISAFPDCILLLEKSATARNTLVDLSVKERMVHDWAILPLNERSETLKEAAMFF